MRDFSNLDSDARVADAVAERNSQIKNAIAGRLQIFQNIYCDLNTAQNSNNAYKISIPFRSIFVRAASDSTAVVYLSPNENSIGNIAEAMPIYKNDSFDFGIMMSGGFLWWPAQGGKTMSLIVSTLGHMQPGSQISQISGGLSVSDGSAIASNKLSGAVATIACAAGAATKILDADTDRKTVNIYIDGDAWVGDSLTSPNARGIFVQAGNFEFKATSALYLYPASGPVNVYGNDFR